MSWRQFYDLESFRVFSSTFSVTLCPVFGAAPLALMTFVLETLKNDGTAPFKTFFVDYVG
jgi:hypothetical protein